MSPPNSWSNREWLTEAEVTLLIAKELQPYHKENQEKFEELFEAMNRLVGAIKTAVWVVGTILAVGGLMIALYKR